MHRHGDHPGAAAGGLGRYGYNLDEALAKGGPADQAVLNKAGEPDNAFAMAVVAYGRSHCGIPGSSDTGSGGGFAPVGSALS